MPVEAVGGPTLPLCNPALTVNVTDPPGCNVAFVVISNRVFGGVFSSFSFSIVSLYSLILFTFGQFIRLLFSNLVARIPYDDIQNADRLLALVESIYVARWKQEMRMEEILYRRLIKIMRTAPLLIELTKRDTEEEEGRGSERRRRDAEDEKKEEEAERKRDDELERQSRAIEERRENTKRRARRTNATRTTTTRREKRCRRKRRRPCPRRKRMMRRTRALPTPVNRPQPLCGGVEECPTTTKLHVTSGAARDETALLLVDLTFTRYEGFHSSQTLLLL